MKEYAVFSTVEHKTKVTVASQEEAEDLIIDLYLKYNEQGLEVVEKEVNIHAMRDKWLELGREEKFYNMLMLIAEITILSPIAMVKNFFNKR